MASKQARKRISFSRSNARRSRIADLLHRLTLDEKVELMDATKIPVSLVLSDEAKACTALRSAARAMGRVAATSAHHNFPQEKGLGETWDPR